MEQVEIILQELQKKMKVDQITKIEKKQKKFIHVMHWLGMKYYFFSKLIFKLFLFFF